MSTLPHHSQSFTRLHGPILFLYLHSFLLFFLVPTTSSVALSAEYVLRNVFQHKDQCYKDSFVYIPAVSTQKSPFHTFSTTKECAQRLREEDLPAKLPNCPPGLLDLQLRPVYVAKSQISYPYANLNISVTAHASVETVAFRLQCLSTSDGSDVYCSNSKAMFIDGVKEWPCRAIRLSPEVQYPVRFSYSCFRLTSHSIYAINATVLPQKCRASVIVTAPNFEDLFPQALVDPADEKDVHTDPFWAPMLSVDLSDEHGVWIRLGKAEHAKCDRMAVNVYKEYSNDSQKVSFLETLEMKCPTDSVKLENLAAGRYLLTAYVPIRGCKFICEPADRTCRQCLRTHLNLEIPENRASIGWLAVQKMKDLSFEIFVASLLILFLLVTVMIGGLLVAIYRRRRDSKRVREIQLSTYVKTMIVYVDDNEEHTNCVRVMVDCLRHCATCEPVFDLEKLITAEQLVPSRWLVDQMSSLPKFVIVISPCAEKILDTRAAETHRLVQTRPFPDLFGPAIEMIIRDVTLHSPEARQKYVIVRFSYSPPVPPNLAVLNLPVYNLPEQFGHLTAFLHDLEDVEQMNISQNLSRGRLNDWETAVRQQVLFCEQHPNWLETRWRPKDDQQAEIQFSEQSPTFRAIQTHQDRLEAARKFNIEPPREDSDDEPAEQHQFVLYPPGMADSDVEDDDDEDGDDGTDRNCSDETDDDAPDELPRRMLIRKSKSGK
ncbi:unnamed protein product [Caenorhabditis sp. 36 PRJEB53466]|nr:unnamed protein product [Caenorhabditis sp. 36 PRJEB53466]